MGSSGQNGVEQVSLKHSPQSSPARDSLSNSSKADRAMDQRLKSFESIVCNEYLTERSKSKEAKRMVCDCSLSKEELARGEKGCGEDCLNRLLMIECGSRCSLGNLCSNKRFQNCQYAKCEVVKTEKKGFGLKSLESLPSGHFLMEYVGEVIDPKEFRRRAKEYAKDKNRHYYFMALKSNSLIDATHKGNISRFINHSCEPNAETQKWTVNGELRIGFFSKRPIVPGEEITFDYQLQRYGKEAQRCYCESQTCRGWIGEDPEKEKERERKELSGRKERKEKKRKEEKRKDVRELLDDMDLEGEIEKLFVSGVKNKAHTVTLCRLMVRTEDNTSRSKLLDIAKEGDTRCLRLFLDYHGLALMWSWMIDNSSTQKLKSKILDTLAVLPIQNKTMLKDSKVLSIVEKWAKVGSEALAPSKRKERSSTEDENSTSPSGDSQTGAEAKSGNEETKEGSTERNQKESREGNTLIEKSKSLLQKWSALKEEFRIPKKQRIEQMKEHEREADLGYTDPREKQSYDRHRNSEKDSNRYRDKEKKKRDSPDVDWGGKKSRATDDRNANSVPRMPKAQRRQLFAMKVEEEERAKKQLEELWQKHQEQCTALGVDPVQTSVFNPHTGFPAYYHPAIAQWHNFPSQQERSVPCDVPDNKQIPSPIFSPSQPPPNMQPNVFPTRMPFMGTNTHPPPFMEGGQFPGAFGDAAHNSPLYPVNVNAQPFMEQTRFPPPPHTYHPPPLPAPSGFPPMGFQGNVPPTPMPPPPASVPFPTYQAPLPHLQTPSSPVASTFPESTPPLPLHPPPPPLKLPPKWKSAKDKEGRTYYYHTKTRKSQWQFPVYDPNDASESSSDSSDSSDMDDSSSDEDDDKVQEEEDEEDDDMMTEVPMEIGETEKQEEMPLVKEMVPVQDIPEPILKKRREGLVQVAIISPRDDNYYKGTSKSKIRDAKEKILRQKMKMKARARKRHASSTSAKCEADTSSGPKRRIKDMFRINMANVVVTHLNAYRKPECKVARITSTEDFKHLARKLTHFVMLKELRHCLNVEDLECNDNVKHKARDFIKKYMAKFGEVYKRPPED